MSIVVGLDIGSSAVRAVEVASRGRSVKVRKAGRVPLAAGAVEGGQVRDAAEVTRAIRRLWHETKFSTRAVRLAIGSGSVLVRPVELEWMPAPDLRKAMRYLVADLLPVPVDEANIDHVLLGDVERDGRRMARVLLVATARDGVDDVVRAVGAAGLRPMTADLSPLALVRAAARLQEPSAPETEAVVDVGADKVAVAVHTRGLPRFVRVVPGVGGATLTRAVVAATGEDDATVEERKRHCDLGPTAQPNLGAHALRQAASALALEVHDTLQFHAQADPEHPAERIVLCGMGAAVPGFADVFAETVGLPTSMLAPPAHGHRDSASGNDPRRLLRVVPRDGVMSVLTGAARPADPATGDEAPAPSRSRSTRARRSGRPARRTDSAPTAASVNLLSPWKLEELHVRRLRRRFAAAAVVLLVVVAAGWGMLRLDLGRTKRDLADDQAIGRGLREQISDLADVQSYVGKVRSRAHLVEDQLGEQIAFSEVLRSIADDLPPGAAVTSLTVSLPTPLTGATAGTSAVTPVCPGADPYGSNPVVGCVDLQGTARTRDDVSTIVRTLARTGLLVEPFITTTTIGQGAGDGGPSNGVSFQGSLGISKAAYTSRFVDVAGPAGGTGGAPTSAAETAQPDEAAAP